MSDILVAKVGGRLVEDEPIRHRLLDELAGLRHSDERAGPQSPIVLVHGGGGMASAISRQLGFEPRMIDGRRVTGPDDLRVAVMVYAGWMNKLLVAELQARGRAALGLSGADGDLVRAHRRPVTPAGVDFGFVGDVDGVNAELLQNVLDIGLTPVICALSHDGRGQLLNTNADTIATEVARALTASGRSVRFHGYLDKPGVLLDADDEASLLAELDGARYAELRSDGRVHSGMLPKLDTAFGLLRAGVAEVRLRGVGHEGTLLRE